MHEDPNSNFKIVDKVPVLVHLPDALVRKLADAHGQWQGSMTLHVEMGENGPVPTATARGEAQPYQLGLAAALSSVSAQGVMYNCAHMQHDVPVESEACREIVERWQDIARKIIESIGLDNVFIDGDEVAEVARSATRTEIHMLVASCAAFLQRVSDTYADRMTQEDREWLGRNLRGCIAADKDLRGVPMHNTYKT